MDINLLAYVIVAIASMIVFYCGVRVRHAAQGWLDHRDPQIRANLARATRWSK